MGVELGEEFGYSTGTEKKISSKTKLSVVTEGTLLQQVIQDPLLTKYNCVIIDEVHERNIDTDMLVYFVAEAVSKRKDLKMMIMSADAEFDRFRKYFRSKFGLKISNNNLKITGVTKETVPTAKHAPNIINPETNKPYTDWNPYFLFDDSKAGKMLKIDELLQVIGNHIVKILKKEPLPHDDFFEKNKDTIKLHDILVFFSGGAELDAGCLKIKELLGNEVVINPKNNNHNAKYGCFVLKSDMKEDDKNLVTKNNHDELGIKQKIIFSTNVAEASVTIDSIAFVIDAAQANVSSYDKEKDVKTLSKQYITKAQIKQRIGRVGRTQEGATYFAYTMIDYLKKTNDYKVPQIHSEDLSSRVLQIISMDSVGDFGKLITITDDLLDPPNHKTIYNSLNKMIYYGCIDRYNEITSLGKIMSSFNKTSLSINRALCYSETFGVNNEIVILILIFGESGAKSNIDLLITKDMPRKIKDKYVSNNDFITSINIFRKYYKKRIKVFEQENELDMLLDEKIKQLGKLKDKAVNLSVFENEIVKFTEYKKKRGMNLERTMKKYCDDNYLVHKKLEECFKKLIELKNPIENGFMNMFDNDIVYKKILKGTKKNNRPYYTIPGKNVSWNDFEINDNYEENLLKCLLSGGFNQILVLDETKGKYYKIGTKEIVQVENPNLLPHLRGINFSLPKDKNKYPRYIFYAVNTLIGMNQVVNYLWGFNNPMLFFIPGLMYYLSNHHNFVNHRDLIMRLKDKLSSFSTELNIKMSD